LIDNYNDDDDYDDSYFNVCLFLFTEVTHQTPTWNFWKFLIDHDGNVMGAWGPQTSVGNLIPTITKAVEAAKQGNGVGLGVHERQDL